MDFDRFSFIFDAIIAPNRSCTLGNTLNDRLRASAGSFGPCGGRGSRGKLDSGRFQRYFQVSKGWPIQNP